MNLKANCPKCGGIGNYIKSWDMTQRRQKKGESKGVFEQTGKITRVHLFKCQKCQRNFRKGDTITKFKADSIENSN